VSAVLNKISGFQDKKFGRSATCLHNEVEEVSFMIMHSRRRIRIRGVVAETLSAQFLMPDDHIRFIHAVVIGATNFARVGKFETLDWPTQTVFAEFNQEFLRSELPLGYARPLTLNGHLVKSHLTGQPADQHFIQQFRHQQRNTIGQKFEHWLAREQHKQDPTWPKTVAHLQASIEAYMDAALSLAELSRQFEKVYHAFGPYQQQRVHALTSGARSLAAKFERSIDERLPIAYLLMDVQRVINFQYGDARDLKITSEPNDFECRDEAGYLQHMFNQVQLQKAEFKRLDLPFYDPDWLARQRRLNEPVWEPSSLKAYHLYEEDSDAR
jgi:hypothetical protein